MDALDILTSKEKVHPSYQAIFSADEQAIIGYDVLGHISNENSFSLGLFFSDDTIPEEYRLEIDNIILHKALQTISPQSNNVGLIFLKRNVNLLMIDRGESFLKTLLQYKDEGIQLNRIVLQISEHQYKGDIEQLCHLLNYYRTFGIKVAADHIGKESSNLNRIARLEPHFLKIDLSPFRLKTPSQSYHDVLYSISLLARKIGAGLLYEKIDTSYQLQYAWKNGGQMLQGDYLKTKTDDYICFSSDEGKRKLKEEFREYIKLEKAKLDSLFIFEDQLNSRVAQSLNKRRNLTQEFDQLIIDLTEQFSDCCFRIYICDEDGYQKSSNILRTGKQWELQRDYQDKNWSWRPYFLENVDRMRRDKKGFLSDLYSDIESGEIIRTFSYPLNELHYLFMDLPYAFLYEQDGLL
ncbi:EAL-associated domain-containing protein [Bacillus carboniphilus]|uniref:EAL-associated domain-containing protein n=1 Tax=Bacillus carboniphilus TaxID=86663 RepID=A0ABY9JUV4_9BACI|nr:EAL-associated domain-containing protein [Bacillus carboniphilus]WLR43194.1 EAL-associated domain-containing protein [Bacillus carboniphilus]